MFDGLFQPTHLLLILIIVLIVFGPGKLPELGKSLGQGIREMRESLAALDTTYQVHPPTEVPTGHTPAQQAPQGAAPLYYAPPSVLTGPSAANPHQRGPGEQNNPSAPNTR